MLGAIQNIITNPTLYNMTQSTVTQVTTETTLKAVGRPSFILADKQIDPQTKKFSATKEFLYQLTCLGIYLSLIHQFKRASFSIGRTLFKDESVFKAFKHPGEFMEYYKMDNPSRVKKLQEINQKSADKQFKEEEINIHLGKGIIESCSMIGTVVGLAILAPIVSHPLIHPILKALKLDKQAPKVQNTNNSQEQSKPNDEKLDKKA